MSNAWSLWIIVLTAANLILLVWLLMANRKHAVVVDAQSENGSSGSVQPDVETTGHVYDGIEEYNNPLPRWWFYMFLGTIIYAVGYLIVYPGMGAYRGLSLGEAGAWTSSAQLQAEQAQAQSQYEGTFGEFVKTPIPELAKNTQAMKMGYRLFLNNCAVCHGSDASGNPGYPNLMDKDWLYGGSPEKILETLVLGRRAAMPAWSAVLGEEKIASVTEFVLKRAGREHDATKALSGASLFAANCAACHGEDGKGKHVLGAPNLTDSVWLYGGEAQEIRQTLRSGRNGVMPAQEKMLKPERIHLLAAYVYSLSQDEAAP